MSPGLFQDYEWGYNMLRVLVLIAEPCEVGATAGY